MVYVFGIDLPLIEILFVYVVLILFALVVLLIELAKLKRLMLIEKSDIFKFTKSVQELEEYIKSSLLQGYSKHDIKRMLYSKGWTKSTVDNIFRSLKPK